MMQLPQSDRESAPIEPRQAIPYATDGTQFATLAEVTAVVIRLFAMMTVLQMIGSATSVVSLTRGQVSWDRLYPMFATPVAQLVVSVILWFLADPLSRFFAPPRSFPFINTPSIMDRVHRIAFATLGVFLLCEIVPELVNFIVTYSRSSVFAENRYGVMSLENRIAIGLRLAISLWLIVGNNRIRQSWDWFWLRVRRPNFR